MDKMTYAYINGATLKHKHCDSEACSHTSFQNLQCQASNARVCACFKANEFSSIMDKSA